MSSPEVLVAESFDDESVAPAVWSALLDCGATPSVALEWWHQRSWWEENGSGASLRLVVARRASQVVAIAPLFHVHGMVMNLCPTMALDFVGDVGEPGVLEAMLQRAMESVTAFVGFRFYFLSASSPNRERLRAAAERLGLEASLEEEFPSPYIDLQRSAAELADRSQKTTTLRRERLLRRAGSLEVHHFRRASEVLPQLDGFFEQHVTRWASTPTPSKYRDPRKRRAFVERTEALADQGWLRFSRLDWRGRPIAFHRGSCYRGQYRYDKATFDAAAADYSPGAVLLRHLIIAAVAEGASRFEFGLGEEAYKLRYATDVVQLQTWGLYPRRS